VAKDYVLEHKSRRERNLSNLSRGARRSWGMSGEYYLAALLGLNPVDSGTRRPDLHIDKSAWSHDLHIEAKSTLNPQKADLYVDQMVGFAQGFGLYEQLFGRPSPLTTQEVQLSLDLPMQKPSNVFLSTLARTSRTADEFVTRPYFSMDVTCGDCLIYPFELGFSIYMAEYTRKLSVATTSSISYADALDDLHKHVADCQGKTIAKHVMRTSVANRNGWQNVSTALLKTIQTRDLSYLVRAKSQQETLQILQGSQNPYLDVKSLEVGGPFKSKFTFLYYEPQAEHINYLASQIESQTARIVDLDNQRKTVVTSVYRLPHFQILESEFESFSQKTGLSHTQIQANWSNLVLSNKSGASTYGIGGVPTEVCEYLGLTEKKMKRFEELVRWGHKQKPICSLNLKKSNLNMQSDTLFK
jgi:hypothetical protein